jgi:ferric-dicitrate binding protein FerR (iron transport regulator)
MVAAAALVAALTVGGYFIFFNGKTKPAGEVAVIQPAVSDVEAPKATRATITLADGRTVALDSLTAMAQNNVQLSKTADGRIIYSGIANAVAHNTLTNPRGSRVIDITLADGSKVWLNAGSSITYPIAFTGNERKVEMTGEAYFEITHDKTRPFYVSKGAMQVEVMGTHFNVNAYDDEETIKTTLLEGRVRVVNRDRNKKYEVGSKNSEVILNPGEQAIAHCRLPIDDCRLIIHHSPDLDEVMAWKNGLFEFNETDIQTIMKQIERWYDVQVVFDGEFTQHFNGSIKRQVNVSKVLNMLEKTGGLRFSIEGRKVLVKKY